MPSRRSSIDFIPTDEDAAAFVRSICALIKDGDFAFTVNAIGTPWDVYRFTTPSKQKGMIAFRAINERWEIGFFRAGEWAPEAIEKALIEGAPS